jgi:hypothetical protein
MVSFWAVWAVEVLMENMLIIIAANNDIVFISFIF